MKGPVPAEEFEALVTHALESLPEDLAVRMSNVDVVIEDLPDTELAEQMDVSVEGLLGLYQGIPLTERGSSYHWVLPDRITLYRRNIVALAKDRKDLTEIVRRTVIHEVAHHFGIDDDRLDELGWA